MVRLQHTALIRGIHMKRTRVGSLVRLTLTAAVAVLAVAAIAAQNPGAWKVLFDGGDLSAFTMPAGRGRSGAPPPDPNAPWGWHVENGVLIGGQAKPGERTGSLATLDKYYDFEIELEFQISELGTGCTDVLGPEEQNMSPRPCVYNSGISYRSGYQLNIGNRAAGEYIGLVIHREDPKAIRGNILWLSHGDKDHPGLRKNDDWNTLRIAVRGDHHETWLNGTKIVDVMDKSTLESEAAWRQPQPVTIQMPYSDIEGGFVKYRNVRIRTL